MAVIISALALGAWFTLPEFEQYDSIDDFKKEIENWVSLGMSIEQANEILANEGFACEASACFKTLSGLPCNQRLGVFFKVNELGKVVSFNVLQKNGVFLTACL